MRTDGASAVVTGGASGLGLATATRLVERGIATVIVDLPTSAGATVAADLGAKAHFSPADVTDSDAVGQALDVAEGHGPIRVLVHCAGRGGTVRLVERDGSPGSLDLYENLIRINLIGTFNMLRLVAARMAANEPAEGERGVCICTASVAAYEGQVGQIPYASAKAGVVGMTLVAARDLANKYIRVVTIAPGIFDTPILDRLPDEVKQKLAASVPNPARLGFPSEFAALAMSIVDNPYLNGEVIRLDGAVRMSPR
jgi:NAD(P)-dependent dehydrogenase (short-subunit alcohol dehydrogenase family)